MKDIIPAKKQSPILGLSGMGGGVGGNLGGSLAEKIYADDLFSTYLYTGNTSSSQTFNNGVDLTEGGLVWIKNRASTYGHQWFDTVRGVNKRLRGDLSNAQDTQANTLTAFNSNGFTIGTNGEVSDNNTKHASWSFRQAPGFFTICQWTGNGSEPRQIAHDLGCMPGLIVIKNLTTGSTDWRAWHRDFTATQCISLNLSNALVDDNNIFGGRNTGSVMPTSTYFEIGAGQDVNENGSNFIAYVFGGGESTAATARSVDFDGSGDYLTTNQSSDYAMGTGDFTVEGWFKINSGSNFGLFMNNTSGLGSPYGVSLHYYTGYGLAFYAGGSKIDSNIHPAMGSWFHVALVRNSGTTSLYFNGTKIISASDNTNWTSEKFFIGGYESTSYLMNGSVSNFRVVKGTAVYTSSFKPTYEPLTNITNTKLLCCNNSSVTGATTGTLTSSGDPAASTDSPFDDPEGFKFGEEEDQNIIKIGSYTGNGNANGPEIYLGFEPQWVLTKNASANDDWYIFDSMRGIVTDGHDARLKPSSNAAEQTGSEKLNLTSTGFKVKTSNNDINGNGSTIIYMAIRRPDGLVGKPPEAGTNAFALDTGNSSSTIPAFDSGFPVDFGIKKSPASSGDWNVTTRLTGLKVVKTNSSAVESTSTTFVYDSNVGWAKSQDSNDQGWMWKRGAGFDVMTWDGDNVQGRQLMHNLNAVPEMIWVKCRSHSEAWSIYHKGLNGGTNPWEYFMMLNTNKQSTTTNWNNTAPTSTHFSLGLDGKVNEGSAHTYVGMLFASVDGISKVGSYDGSNSNQTITTGFTPRFLILKNITTTGDNWYTLDTTRGWGSGNDNANYLNTNAGYDVHDFGAPTSTGFTLNQSYRSYNLSGEKYIYYAHA